MSINTGLLFGLCELANQSNEYNVFFDYSGHVNQISIHVDKIIDKNNTIEKDYSDYVETIFRKNIYINGPRKKEVQKAYEECQNFIMNIIKENHE